VREKRCLPPPFFTCCYLHSGYRCLEFLRYRSCRYLPFVRYHTDGCTVTCLPTVSLDGCRYLPGCLPACRAAWRLEGTGWNYLPASTCNLGPGYTSAVTWVHWRNPACKLLCRCRPGGSPPFIHSIDAMFVTDPPCILTSLHSATVPGLLFYHLEHCSTTPPPLPFDYKLPFLILVIPIPLVFILFYHSDTVTAFSPTDTCRWEILPWPFLPITVTILGVHWE